MIEANYLKISPHKANAIDKRAIANLKWHILDRISREYPHISKDTILDECNYRIVEVDGYENIAFFDDENMLVYEVVQPIDRDNGKLFPMQTLELTVQYKRYYF